MTEISVNTASPYKILLGAGLLAEAGERVRAVSGAKQCVLVTDSNVAPLYGERVRASLAAAGFETAVTAFPAGEAHKNHETLLALYRFFAEVGVTRRSLLVALGGGVVGDTVGFAAATWLRGVPFVQIPTTLLAQIDSSVGGKTAVDLPEGKNLVGAFYQPRLVLIDPDTLDTLPARVLHDGVAEAIKYGVIRDAALFDSLASGRLERERVIRRCVEIKRDVVEADEFERGERMLLNFGHTIGHAVESLGHYDRFTHGEAVGIGMLRIARAGERLGKTKPGTADAIEAALRQYALPTQSPYGAQEMQRFVLRDKKRADGEITLVLAQEIGSAYLQRVPLAEVEQYLAE